MNRFGIEVRKYRRIKPQFDERVVSLKPDKNSRGNVLLAYILDPFFLNNNSNISAAHTNHWESYQIAKTFLDLGYAVDAIDYRNFRFAPQKEYTFFVSARTNLHILAQKLNKSCIKIAHLDTAHIGCLTTLLHSKEPWIYKEEEVLRCRA